jgi:hypothetical protein
VQGWGHAIFDEQAAFQRTRLEHPAWGMPDAAPSPGRESARCRERPCCSSVLGLR